MSRLERYQKKELRKNIVVFVLIGFLFVVFMSTIGLPLLVNTSLFIGRLLGGGRETPEKRAQILGDFTIDEIPVATNSARIIIGGSVTNISTLEVYLNNAKVKELDVEDESDFSTDIDGLELGENEIYLVGRTKKSNEKRESSTYTVVYKKDKPKLEISEPLDNTKTLRDEVKISGKTDKGNSISVNDAPVTVSSNGDFQTLVKLKDGENKIRIVATDTAGNSEEKTLTITYEKD
ncbi:hypothetical protein HYT33_04745 [Candidatus Roizmanbacteria bacterium]|nr:hypothetical protein [Candidatus Roizmanbacteria bacterium]